MSGATATATGKVAVQRGDRGDHDRSPSGDFDHDSRRNRDDMTKDETEAYEQLAADVKFGSGIRRVNADIFELMGKNLTPSTEA